MSVAQASRDLQLHGNVLRRWSTGRYSLDRKWSDEAHAQRVCDQLGNGYPINGDSHPSRVESILGFTALDGLPMGTRPGQLDPGVVLYLIAQKGMSPAAVQDLFYHECGLKGLSGLSNEVREAEANSNPMDDFALEYFAYHVGLNAGMLTATLGGINAFVFTAGIGENSASMRARIAHKFAWLGVSVDMEANAASAPLTSQPNSRIPLYVLPTNEELMIARHTLALVSAPDEHESVNQRNTG